MAMDTVQSSKKIPKFKSLNSTVSPLHTRLNADSMLIRYLCGGADDDVNSPPISAKSSSSSSCGVRAFGRSLENVMSPQVHGTPVKVMDDDVLVMDGILVESASRGRVSRLESSGSTSDSSSSSSPSPAAIRTFKSEICRSWDGFGHCRFGSKCQFAHGEEEMRPSCFAMKNSKAEAHAFKSSTAGCVSSYGQRSRFLPPEVSVSVAVTKKQTVSSSISKPEHKNKSPGVALNTTPVHLRGPTITLAEPELSSGSPTTTNAKFQEWSPLDDGIEVSLPGETGKLKSPRKDDVDAYMHSVLHGPKTKKRLPAFTEFN